MSQRFTLGTVAVIGCGNWGKNLVRNFARIGALGALADADPELAASHAREHSVPALSFEEILGRADIPAVAIATPAETHASLALRALQADKHVFVEKPLALRVEEGARLSALARERGRTLMVGHLLRYHPAFLRLKEMVDDGELGRLQYVYSNRLNLGKIRREEDVFWSFAPHDISMILALAGEEPETVAATGVRYLHSHIADVTTTHLAFANGVNAHVFVSWLHPFKEQKLVVVGDRGMAVFDDTEPWPRKVALYAHQVSWNNGMPEPVRAEARYVEVAEAEPLGLECEHFLACVSDGSQPTTDGDEGVRVLRVLSAAAATMARASIASPGSEASIESTEPSLETRFPEAFVHRSSYVDGGVEIGPGTRIWHFCHLLSGTRIGRDCVVGQNVMAGPDVVIADGCKIQNNVSLYKGVVLERGVFCGPSCVFTNVLNPRAETERKDEFRQTLVGRGATIGANATIICGNPIGQYAFIAAGAVVTHPVPPHAIVAGVPARQIGWMSHAGERLGKDLTCPRSGRRYRENGPGRLLEIDAGERER